MAWSQHNEKALLEELYEERRRKWRRSGFWRGIFLSLGLLFVIGAIAIAAASEETYGSHIAEVDIYGVIYDDPVLDEFLEHLQYDPDVEAIVLRINSPGGTTVGAEALYERIRAISEMKPVVATMGEYAASGGYIAAIAADYVVARGNTITASIGVILEYPDFTGLMEKLGVEMQVIKSDEMKGGPSPFRPTTDDMRQAEQELINDSVEWFRGLVEERRGAEALSQVADGRAMTGRQALKIGLVDEIGGMDEARAYLESQDMRYFDLPVIYRAPEVEEDPLQNIFSIFLSRLSGVRELTNPQGRKLYSVLNP